MPSSELSADSVSEDKMVDRVYYQYFLTQCGII